MTRIGGAKLAADIDLLAPDIIGHLNACLKQFMYVDLSLSLADQDNYKTALADIRRKRTELRNAMRVSMNVANAPRSGR